MNTWIILILIVIYILCTPPVYHWYKKTSDESTAFLKWASLTSFPGLIFFITAGTILMLTLRWMRQYKEFME